MRAENCIDTSLPPTTNTGRFQLAHSRSKNGTISRPEMRSTIPGAKEKTACPQRLYHLEGLCRLAGEGKNLTRRES